MLKHAWSLLCKSAIINSDNNSLSLIDILEGLEFATHDKDAYEEALKNKITTFPLSCEIVSYIYRDVSDKIEPFLIHVDIIDPNNKTLNSSTNELEFPAGESGMRARAKLDSFPFTVNGDYLFKVSITSSGKKKHVANIPFKFKITLGDVETPFDI